jgi:dipeptidyl aminopeptidase/acylaminoacyl peptidase
MNHNDTFDRSLPDWLREDSEHRVPDHLDAVLAQTIATRQRPWWSSLRRWLPIEVALPRAPLTRSGSWRPILALAAVAVLVVALLLLAVGSRRQLPPPFGLARNGVFVTAIGGQLFRVDPIIHEKTPLAGDGPSDGDFGPMFSRDGTRLLYLRGVDGNKAEIVVANADGSAPRVVSPAVDGLDQVDWSPDGSRIVFLSRDGFGRGLINVVNADGTGLTTFSTVPVPAQQVSWLPPHGNAILFRGEQLAYGDPPPGIYTIGPDGMGLREISTRRAANENDNNDVSASPDGTSILYRESPSAGPFRIHVLDLRTGQDQAMPSPATAAGQTTPVFSPDGVHVAYLRITADAALHAGPRYQLVVAPIDRDSLGTELPLSGGLGDDGPTVNNYAFTPDGSAVIANELTSRTEWLLPIDGSGGTVIAQGTAAYDALTTVQRLAP